MRFPVAQNDSTELEQAAHSSTPELTEQAIRAALDAVVLQSLRPICIGLSALYVVFAVSHALFLPPSAATKMSVLASLTAALLLGLYYALRRYALSPSWGHPIGAGIALLILLNSLLHLYLLFEPEQTTNVALLVIGVGCFFLSARWLMLLLALSLGGWLGLVLSLEKPSPAWRHFGFMLLAATVLSVLIHAVRVRALKQLERMHLRDERRKQELERAVHATQLSEERFRQLAEATFEGVAVHEQGELVDVNETLAAMFGYAPSEIIGTNALELIAPESRALVLKNVQSNNDKSFEALGIKRDGTTFPIEICGRAIHQPGRTVSVLAIRDISERKRAEKERAQLIREQAARAEAEAANRAKDEFLATISHELRTPLTSIRGWAHMLRNGQVDEEFRERGLEVIERKAIVQAQLINDLLDVSRIITGKLRFDVRLVELTSLVKMAVDSVRPIADEKSLRLQTDLTATTPVLGDSERLQQVLLNLLSNAIKFTPAGGLVEIKLEHAASQAQISVRDTGVGISPEFLPHVFDRFRQADSSSTRAFGGLGIGLAIAKHLVELHSGTIQAESKGPGEGATFTLKLPLARADVSGLTAADAVETAARPTGNGSPRECQAALQGLRVLVVDDDAETCELLDTVLSGCGAEVKVSFSAHQAFEALDWGPDVLVSDIGMSDQDGYDLIRTVRAHAVERERQIPAIALTAYASGEDRLRALSAGYQLHMPKPVEPDKLIAAVASLAKRTEEI
jgi:PAS domain S-box-containing protein